ncbi:hypothetical protein TrCOL_g8407 [Triparma columacea]|uniref:Acyl carrier protein n=1 Tax=Triparma columacea TaxID=722753 RepID=A0A9W7GPH1_9STRA|nr:hypothetical protein TrCOL_g8407 [Triparma columacea]
MISRFARLARPAALRIATQRATIVTCTRMPTVSTRIVLKPNKITFRAFGSDFFLDPADVTDRIITVVKNFDKVEASKVTPTAKFSTDLGLDSLDAVEVVMAIEDEFAIEIPDVEADKISSVEDAVNYIASHPQAK